MNLPQLPATVGNRDQQKKAQHERDRRVRRTRREIRRWRNIGPVDFSFRAQSRSPVVRLPAIHQHATSVTQANSSETSQQTAGEGRWVAETSTFCREYRKPATPYVSGLMRMIQPNQPPTSIGKNAPESSHMGNRNTLMMA